MAGHSKWAQIKRQKGVNDARKSKVFGKLARLIAVAAKQARGDVNSPALRDAIIRAKKENMPLPNIERAVQKGRGDTGAAMESVVYEAYGPGGVALIIEGLTENRNRTSPELRHLLSKNGAEMAEPGAAAWAFKKEADGSWAPQTTIPLTDEDAEKLSTLVDLILEHDDVQEVYTNAE